MTNILKLKGVIIDQRPGCFKEKGQWKGIAFDILKHLEKVSDFAN